MERNPEIAVERRHHLHQPVQSEPPEVRIANTREVRSGETGQRGGLSYRKTTVIQHGDDPGRENRLGLFQIRKRIVEVAKHIAASLDQFEVAFVHGSSSLFSRPSRPLTRSISALGVLIPVFDFFRNAWITHRRPATAVTYTTRQASVRYRTASSMTPGPRPFSGFTISALPPSAAIVSAVLTRSRTGVGCRGGAGRCGPRLPHAPARRLEG